MTKPMPSIELLRDLFHVDEHGNLIRKKRNFRSNGKPGDIAGSPGKWKHLKVRVNCVCIYNHRVVWAITYGEWPSGPIDHINGIHSDNRPENLRIATVTENAHNRGITKANSSGFRGVCKPSKSRKYIAQITVNGDHINLGSFDTAEGASAAYEAAAKKAYGEFYRPLEKHDER